MTKMLTLKYMKMFMLLLKIVSCKIHEHLYATIIIGDICPTGHYCGIGSTAPTPCQSGYYLNSTGNDVTGDCLPCTGGMYCAGSGNSIPDGSCSPGFYCPGGQDTPTPYDYNCTMGHYCPEGSDSPLRCASGSYQDDIGQWDCKGCPAGFYCDNTMSPVVLYNNTYCPTGKSTRRC